MELNSKKRISINVVFSVLQVGIVGLVYLVIYKILLEKLGAQQLGIWSLILATTSVANIANLGITSGIVKFVAESYAQKEIDSINKIIFTSFLSLLVFFLVLSVAIFPFSKYILKYIVEEKFYSLAISIIPLSLFSLIINSLSGVFTSVLEGIQKNYFKNVLLILSSIIFLLSVIFLTDKYGLIGVAYGQLLQALFLLFASYLLVAFEFKNLLIKISNWNTKTFKVVTSFGLKFQLISILVMFADPITKSFLGKFGGLSFLGYYEMANKLIFQVRAFIVNANQVMIPVLVHSINTSKQKTENIYLINFSLTFLSSLLLMSSLIILTPLISYFWVGDFNQYFMFSMYLLATGVFVNILSSPAYFACIAKGELPLLIKTHFLMTIIIIIFSSFFGKLYGGNAVVISSSFATVISASYLIKIYHKGIKEKIIFNKINLLYLTISTFLCFATIIGFNYFSELKDLKIYLIISSIIYLVSLYSIVIKLSLKSIIKQI